MKIICGLCFLATLVAFSAFSVGRDKAEVDALVKSASNLRQITLATILYVNEKKKFPPSLEALVKDEELDEEATKCPLPGVTYVLREPKAWNDQHEIVAYESGGKDGSNVALTNASVKWLHPADVAKAAIDAGRVTDEQLK